MLEKLFIQVLNMSITSGFVIIIVILARFLLKKAPRILSYALWVVVLFRLVCPFSFESAFSLLPLKSNPIPQDIVYQQTPRIITGIGILDNAVNFSLPAATPYSSVNPLQIWTAVGTFLWVCGMAILLLYSVISLLLLTHKLRGAAYQGDNLYISENLALPFVMGVIRPKIYLPARLTDEEKQYILLHEKTHITRLDPLFKIIGFAALCLHWFNPLVWTAFFLCGNDMEMSCDEAVIKKLGGAIKKGYSSSLLTLATGRRIVGGAPLAFGEGNTKARIKNILRYRKPALWALAGSVLIALTVGAGLLANPKSVEPDSSFRNPENPPTVAVQRPEPVRITESSGTQDGQTNLTFWVKPDEPPEVIGNVAANIWLQSYIGDEVPASERISDYTIEEINVISGTPKTGQSLQEMKYDYVIQADYSIITDSDDYFSPADGISGKGTFHSLFRELCVKRLEHGSFEIVRVSTGGGEQEFLLD